MAEQEALALLLQIASLVVMPIKNASRAEAELHVLWQPKPQIAVLVAVLKKLAFMAEA